MKLFNEQALNAISNMDSADAGYCNKLEQRFANLGICSKTASDAVCTLASEDAVPQVGSWAATPSMFKGIFGKKAKSHTTQNAVEVAFDEVLASSEVLAAE
ncbi:hypothetical protein AALA21_05200 [Eggerthellaceae bacterium 3-80]|nr:hypothetical protein D7W09_05145 [bacterium D16-34]